MPQVKPTFETFAKIKVVGVGGSGNKVIARMMQQKIHGVEFVAINTDAQDLHFSNAPTKVHIGKNLTKGLGAGMDPEIGRKAAEENRDDIQQVLKGSDMVFVTCGLGGGTGSGGGPVVAEAARTVGALTIGIVTKPFTFEGAQRARIAEEAWNQFRDQVDALITIPNDRLLDIIDKKTPILEAFAIVDDVLRHGVQGISDLITIPGLINVDFADIKAIMKDTGSALMGIGRAQGEDRAIQAARQAISSPLLEVAIDGAKGVLFNVSGGEDLTMTEINEAARIITESIDSDAKVIFGSVITDKLRKGEIKITVIATGFGGEGSRAQKRSVRTVGMIDELKNDTVATAQETVPQNGNGFDNGNDNKNGNGNGKTASALKRSSGQEKKSFFEEIIKVGTDDADEFDVPAFIRKKMK